VDSTVSPTDMAQAAKLNGMSSVAITDHGNLFGIYDFNDACISAEIKPIFGIECYTVNNIDDHSSKEKWHIVLLAMNNDGMKNLYKLSTIGFTKGMYFKPRIDDKVLFENSDGLIIMSACVQGFIHNNIINGNIDAATQKAKLYKDVFKDRFYMEIQNHFNDADAANIPETLQLADELKIKLVATNDIHYLKQEDNLLQKMVQAVQWKMTIEELLEKGYFDTPEYYFKTEDEMRALFEDSSVISNTCEVAERCNASILPIDNKIVDFVFDDSVPEISTFIKKTKDMSMVDFLNSGVITKL
jgi:DNA polymerase-3 subunit alpha